MLSRWLDAWHRARLATRIIALTLVLLLAVQAASFGVVRHIIGTNARSQINQDLVVGQQVWQRVLAQNAAKLDLGASVLASDYAFREAIASGDLDTIESALDNHGARVGAATSVLFDASMNPVATGGRQLGSQGSGPLGQIARAMLQHETKAAIGLHGSTIFQFVLVPVRAPLTIGWVLMAFPVDQSLAEDVFHLINIHLVILAGQSGQTLAPVVSTLPMSIQPPVDAETPATPIWTLGGESFVVRMVDMPSDQGRIQAVLLRSLDDALEPFYRLQALLLAITAGGIALFALGSVFSARRVTKPLGELVSATRQLAAGDFATPVSLKVSGQEVAELAGSFEQMRLGLASRQAEINQLAYWDRLTGRPNRERFRTALLQTLNAGSSGVPVSVVTLNLDRFKHVNDVLGYAFGDELLKAFADRLAHACETEESMVARLGGDQFGWLLPGSDAETAATKAVSLARSFEVPLSIQGQTVDARASMGVATWPVHASSADVLLSRSEIAMHAAKARATGLMVYSPELDSASAESLSLLSALQHALLADELRLYLQPKVAVQTGKVVAAEALVRWQHPTRGLVPPMQFIPFAEQTGFIRELTRWMLQQAALQWHGLQPPQGEVRIAVNLSTRDLLDPLFPQELGDLCLRHALTPACFCLEITESAIMDDPERAEATLNRLAQMGFRLSIDDFGTGYSSLAYLRRLPVRELKIDKSFVMGMDQNGGDEAIVRSTIDLAHHLGLEVVAEGVETGRLLERLRALGCDEAQGYHISKPVPADQFVATCDSWHARTIGP